MLTDKSLDIHEHKFFCEIPETPAKFVANYELRTANRSTPAPNLPENKTRIIMTTSSTNGDTKVTIENI